MAHSKTKSMKNLKIIIAAVFWLSLNLAHAKERSYSSATVTGTNWLTPHTITSEITTGPPSSPAEIFYKNKKLYSYVKLSLNTEAIPHGLAAFTANVTVTIKYYLETNPRTTVTEIKTLEVNYDPTTGAKYKNVAIEQIENAYKIEVNYAASTLNISTGSTSAHQNFITLQAFTEQELYYNYDEVFGGSSIDFSDYEPTSTFTYSLVNNELSINWLAIPYAEGYELEYTFVDDYANVGYLPASSLNFTFKHNSTRILLDTNSYKMPVVQEHGYLVWRIRGYGMAGTNFDRIFYGRYSASTNDYNLKVSTFPNKYFVNTTTHTNDKINWQSVTSFAEKGKSKTIVKYMDGTMRSRQTVTSTSTEQNAIIAETIYDFQGRPAVNVLPAPVDKPAIKYYPNFNQNLTGQPYNYHDFDYKGSGACDPFAIGPLKQTGPINNHGAGNYYSQFNPNQTKFNAFIPEANGYPFTRVNYMPDATDRVVRQGNLGEVFQPGNTTSASYQSHDTKYYYGKPVQEKLDRLFGTNVGYAEYYQQNMIVDPNGQVSVNYVDLNGKTIATALAGDEPKSVDALRSMNTTPIKVNLLSGSDVVDDAAHSITNSQSITVSANNTKYNFHYDLNEATFNALSCAGKNYCLDCIYDLEITLVKDECAKVEYQKIQTVGNLSNLNFICNDASASINLDFSATLDIGSYTITKKLIVNKTAAETYVNNILTDPDNTCLKTFDDFYKDAWENRDKTRCKTPCESCKDESEFAETASDKTAALNSCDSLWCNPKMTNMCDVASMSMINDLTPGGQYAVYQNGSGVIDLNASNISIFSIASIDPGIMKLYNAPTSILSIAIDLPGETSHPLSYYTSTPALLTQLINNWPDDLSEKLLPLHPEYCYLRFCYQPYMDSSNDFDTKYMEANSYADANTAGLPVSAIAINTFYTSDALYMNLPITLQNEMQDRFANYSGVGNSIVKLAIFMTNCPAGSSISACSGTWGGANADAEWESFKGLYYNLKQEFLQKAREYFVVHTSGCCPNSYIGCASSSATCPPPAWPHFPAPTPIYSCFTSSVSIIQVVYGSAKKRFATINDITFPGLPSPQTKSYYDMTPDELAGQIGAIDKSSLCPSCPELDAFKMMLFYLQDKKWMTVGGTHNADEILGLKDSLRIRFLGSLDDGPVTISNHAGMITISSGKCIITFTSDTTINFEKATILPTCLEITDYRHAKLHVMVNGEYKTILNLTSTCDLFYCDGTKPTPPVVDNSCHCDSVYDKTKTYHAGDIVKYKDICFIAKNNSDNGFIKPGNYPGNKELWDRICTNSPEPCNDVINILFDGDQALNSQLSNVSSAIQPLTANKYTIRNNYTISGQNITSSPNPAVILYPTLNNQLLFQSTTALQANKNYTLSFDALLLYFGDPDCFTLIVEVNGQTLVNENCIQSRNNPWITRNGWYNYNVSFNTGNVSSATIRFISGKQNVSDIIAIKNIKISCEGAVLNNGSSSTSQTNNSEPTKYIPQSTCGCSGLCDPALPSPELPFIPCDSIQKAIATQAATDAFASYKDSVFNAMLTGYYAKCLQALEHFNMDFIDKEYHYTLYYYDQSGNLVQTVPPAGVKPIINPAKLANVIAYRNANSGMQELPDHFMKTNYLHNALNAVVWQQSPDGGKSEFFYDRLGRIALSQNAQQKNDVTASYTYYDKLNRNVEVGKLKVPSPSTNLKVIAFNYITWFGFLSSQPRTEITHTYYDQTASSKINIAFGTNGQQFLRNRIATVANYENQTKLSSKDYIHATHYNYDIAGNVTDLLQDFGANSPFGQDPINVRSQSKHIAYNFDLVSGKVNQLQYQPGYPDQFLYKYQYNADNKLTAVFTSSNGTVWENDARYIYYRHGPLARTELGTDNIQGTDNVYTLQGWIKGINGFATAASTDIGKDGNTSTASAGGIGYDVQNKKTANDVASYWLSYFNDDYKTIGNATATINATTQQLTTGVYNSSPDDLYNGNIRSMYTNLKPFGGLGMQYRYDQLNRIKKQTAYEFTGGTNNLLAHDAYKMSLEYDPNGNIQTLLRNGTTALPDMDDTKYYYYTTTGTYVGDPTAPNATNKLAMVKDGVAATPSYSDDIENQPDANYGYDAIGNLIKDQSQNINSIEWNIQNKITRIKKGTSMQIDFGYDVQGNRVIKKIVNPLSHAIKKQEYYVRDAQGNTLAVYNIKDDKLNWTEQCLFGSSRFGTYLPDVEMDRSTRLQIPNPPLPINLYPLATNRNSTQYEITNHLGNVLATVSDAKNPNTVTGSFGDATLLSATDYYAFGMAMPDRKFSLSGYRYGFNGKENDDETGTQDYGFRIYNPALGKFLSVDPLTEKYPELTPYQFASNTPIQAIDLDGLEKNGATCADCGNNKTFEIKNPKSSKPKTVNKPKELPAKKVEVEPAPTEEQPIVDEKGGLVTQLNKTNTLLKPNVFGEKKVLKEIKPEINIPSNIKNAGELVKGAYTNYLKNKQELLPGAEEQQKNQEAKERAFLDKAFGPYLGAFFFGMKGGDQNGEGSGTFIQIIGQFGVLPSVPHKNLYQGESPIKVTPRGIIDDYKPYSFE